MKPHQELWTTTMCWASVASTAHAPRGTVKETVTMPGVPRSRANPAAGFPVGSGARVPIAFFRRRHQPRPYLLGSGAGASSGATLSAEAFPGD